MGEKSDLYSWTALKPGGASFRRETFVWSEDILTISKSKHYKRFVGFMFVVPIITCFLISIEYIFDSNPETGVFSIFGYTASGIAISIWFAKWLKKETGKYFDFENHYFHYPDGYVDFDDVVGLQILRERVSGGAESSSFFASYELNLLIKDGVRINVVDHGDVKHIEEHSVKISQALGVEIVRNY